MGLKLTKIFLSKKISSESIIIAFLGLLTLMLFFTFDKESLSANGHLIYVEKEYWRAFTTSLLHADLNHLAHNAFFFTGLAALLHNYFGLWVFPTLSLIIGGFINLVALHFYPPSVHLVGVSGVVYFMASFWLVLYLLIEKRQSVIVRLIHVFAVSLIFLFPEAFEPQTSYLAHGLGFLFGLPVAFGYYLLNRKKIKSKEVWIEIHKHPHPMDDIILLENGEFQILNTEKEDKTYKAQVLPSEET